jgi:hypothetical protein
MMIGRISLLTVSLASFCACWLGDKLTSSKKARNQDFTHLWNCGMTLSKY